MRFSILVPMSFLFMFSSLGHTQEISSSLVKLEKQARIKVAAELVKFSRWCMSAKAFDQAGRELKKALFINPGDPKAKKYLANLAEATGSPGASFSKKYLKKRDLSYRKCIKLLAKPASALFSKGFAGSYDNLSRLALGQFPTARFGKDFGATWFAPYRQWVHPSIGKKLKSGWDLVDAKWLNRSEVAILNKKHRSWSTPWVLSDEVHELTTTMPLRTAKRVLGHIGHFRRFFIKEFQSGWDLKRPGGKLPVILTRTRAEMFTQLAKYTNNARNEAVPAAFYHYSSKPLNPCFLTLELQSQGRATTITIDQLLNPLQHEITHQLAFEYSKHDSDRSSAVSHQFWCSEALANYLAYFVIDKHTWRLARPGMIRFGEGTTQSGFAFCQQNSSSLPALADYFPIPRSSFPTQRNYAMATVLGHFMMEGNQGKYRTHFIKLLEVVHKAKSDSTTLEKCFKGLDKETMQLDWQKFVAQISLD